MAERRDVWASIPLMKSDKQEQNVVVSLTTFKTKEYVDIRVMYQTPGMSEPMPSKKGISIPVGLWPVVMAGLLKIDAQLQPLEDVDEQRELVSDANEGFVYELGQLSETEVAG